MRKKTLVLFFVLFVLVSAFIYIKITSKQKNTDSLTKSQTAEEQIIISPQSNKDQVIIDYINLTQSGFAVVRNSDGNRLSQVIEISKYLEPGEYKNILIPLGEFYNYDSKDELIVMVYRDNNGDKTFNDLDQPAEYENATNKGWFVKSGQPVPSSMFLLGTISDNSMGMETVIYTNSGFKPENITVPKGTMVEFINQSDKVMWVASDNHPSHEILPTFDQFNGGEKGKTYMYTFDKGGTWAYHDHINPAQVGTITVE